MMKTSLSKHDLLNYLIYQVNNLFPDGNPVKKEIIAKHFDRVLQRVEFCFSKINNKYFYDGQYAIFNHLHGDQYSMFLYFLSNELFREKVDTTFCNKFFLLNKTLHGIDAFYEVDLPNIFLFIHPLATVLGRAKYEDYFIVYQRCGIGSNRNIYPEFDQFVTMHPGSSVLGKCKIGRNCEIAAESLVLDKDLSDNTLYIGNPKEFFEYRTENISNFWR